MTLRQVLARPKKANRASCGVMPNDPPALFQQASIPVYPSRLPASDGAAQASLDAIAKRGRVFYQTKSMLGPVSDRYEQEADRVADQVVRQASTVYQYSPKDSTEVQRKSLVQAQRATVPQGETIDPTVETQIRSARGGGQPLPILAQRSMGAALGQDFSDVKVHTGKQAHALNTTLQARAFTTGNDIFFRDGEYDPNSRQGQHTLAHELTHVVQQTGMTQRLIQRKVGLELEVSSWKTWQPKHITTTMNAAMNNANDRKPFKKGEPIIKKPGFELQADELEGGESDMEFVTKPFEENDEAGLTTVLQAIQQLCIDMQQRMLQKGTVRIPFKSALKGNGSPKHRGFFDSNGIVVFKPQATGGIKLEALAGMMQDIGQSQGGESLANQARLRPGREALMSLPGLAAPNAPGEGVIRVGAAGPGARAAINAYRGLPGVLANITPAMGAGWQGSDKLHGLAALIITYIEAARYPLPNYAKAIAPIMARTDFAAMFAQLPDAEKTYFSANNGTEWVRLLSQVPDFANPVNLADGTVIPAVNMAQPLFESGIYHSKPAFNHGILDSLTRRLWLRGMTQGTDYLTRKHIAATGAGKIAKPQIESLGSHGRKTEKVGLAATPNARTNAPIFELRGMDRVDRQDLVTWGVNVLRYIRALNYGVNAKYGE